MSLRALGGFPFDRLTIDPALVGEIGGDVGGTGASAAVARAIVGMAQAFGIAVAADGVASEHQMRHLVAAGCAELRGDFFGAPCVAGEVAGLLGGAVARSAASA
jgi:EAL domain-containing protein (putative c-di-GMP-specific phosphodiesterase class I)